MPSIQAQVMNKIASLALKSYRGSGAGFVRRFRMVTAASNLLAPVPKGLKHIKGQLGGVPGEWLIPVNPKGALLYIHGGGFVAGHPPMYRPFCGALANALGFRVFMVDYRLAPENPFPAPLDDCIAAFEAWVKKNQATYPEIVFSHDPQERGADRASHKLYGVGGIPHRSICIGWACDALIIDLGILDICPFRLGHF